jgi:hypothetical protein
MFRRGVVRLSPASRRRAARRASEARAIEYNPSSHPSDERGGAMPPKVTIYTNVG